MNIEERTTAVATAELEALTNEFLRAVSFRAGERPSYDRRHFDAVHPNTERMEDELDGLG